MERVTLTDSSTDAIEKATSAAWRNSPLQRCRPHASPRRCTRGNIPAPRAGRNPSRTVLRNRSTRGSVRTADPTSLEAKFTGSRSLDATHRLPEQLVAQHLLEKGHKFSEREPFVGSVFRNRIAQNSRQAQCSSRVPRLPAQPNTRWGMTGRAPQATEKRQPGDANASSSDSQPTNCRTLRRRHARLSANARRGR